MFNQPDDSNFHVFLSNDTFAVISESVAEEGFEIASKVPPIMQALSDAPPRRLDHFGGKLAIFDASLPALAIRLRDVGCARVEVRDEAVSHTYDAALVDVAVGAWDLHELEFREDVLAFDGLLFRKTPCIR